MRIILDDEIRDSDVGRPSGDPAHGRAAPSSRPRRRTILLVEDSEADRDLYGGLLWYNGFDVFHAADGDAAVARATEIPPDLVLMDYMLPGANGLDVARRLKEEGVEAPIVLLTALSRDEVGEPAPDLGIVDHLEKPIDPFAVMKEVVRRIGFAPLDGTGR